MTLRRYIPADIMSMLSVNPCSSQLHILNVVGLRIWAVLKASTTRKLSIRKCGQTAKVNELFQKLIVAALTTKFTEPKISLPWSQEPATTSYPEPTEYSTQYHALYLQDPFQYSSTYTLLPARLNVIIRATFCAHLIFLAFIILILDSTYGETS
jgi:hypothetical protein